MEKFIRNYKQTLAMILALCLIISPFSAVPAKADSLTVSITLDAFGGYIYDESNTKVGETKTEDVLLDDLDIFFNKISKLYSVENEDKHLQFAGWSLPGKYTAATADDIKIYAQSHSSFRLLALYDTVYVVTFDSKGGVFADGTDSKKVSVADGTKFSAIKESVSKTGYTFNGWFTDDKTFTNAMSDDTAITKDMAIYASFEPKKYKVDFSVDGKVLEGKTKEVLYDSSYGNIFPTVTKDAYDFDNWYDSEANDAKAVTNATTVKTDKDHVLYARFTPHVYKIEYDLDGGTLKNKVESYTAVSVSGNSVSANDIVIGAPEKKYFDFTGWTVTKDKAVLTGSFMEYVIEAGTTSDFVFKANFEPHKYKITYDLDGGTLKDMPETYTSDMDEYILIGAPEKAGYDFKGWIVTKDGKELHNTYMEYPIDIGMTSDFNFKANFEPHKYTINYDLDGGTLEGMVKEYTVEMKEFLLIREPVRDGYDFTGWTVTKDGTALTNVYMTYPIEAGTTSDFVFKASWKKQEDKMKKGVTTIVNGVEYTVTAVKANSKGMNEATEVSVTKAQNEKIKSLTVPATVMINGVSAKVTKIESKAFMGCDKLTKVTIGKNIKTIGAKAFFGCEKLKTVTVKSSVLKKVGSKAFKDISSKATIKTLKAKKKTQQKMFKKSGIGYVKTWKIK